MSDDDPIVAVPTDGHGDSGAENIIKQWTCPSELSAYQIVLHPFSAEEISRMAKDLRNIYHPEKAAGSSGDSGDGTDEQ